LGAFRVPDAGKSKEQLCGPLPLKWVEVTHVGVLRWIAKSAPWSNQVGRGDIDSAARVGDAQHHRGCYFQDLIMQKAHTPAEDQAVYSSKALLRDAFGHRRLAGMIGLAVLVLGLTYIVRRSDSFEISSAIDIGTRSGPEGRMMLLEPISSVVSKINDIYLVKAEREMRKTSNDRSLRRTDFTTRTAKDASVVILRSRSLDQQAPDHIAVQRQVMLAVLADHDQQVAVVRSDLERDLAISNAELAQLQDNASMRSKAAPIERRLELTRLQLETLHDPVIKTALRQQREIAIKSATNALADFEGQKAARLKELAQIDLSRQLLERRRAEVQAFVDTARTARRPSASSGSSSGDALTLMLLDAEAQRQMSELNRLDERIMITIPAQQADISRSIAELDRVRGLQVDIIAKAEAELQKHLAEQVREIERVNPDLKVDTAGLEITRIAHATGVTVLNARIQGTTAQLKNLRQTTLLLAPDKSADPIGLGRSLLILLSAIAATLIAALAAVACALLARLRANLR
jgi:hypothetical protein